MSFVCVMPVRTSNSEQVWSTSVVAFRISLYYPQTILITIIIIIIIIIIKSSNLVNGYIQPIHNFDEKQV